MWTSAQEPAGRHLPLAGAPCTRARLEELPLSKSALREEVGRQPTLWKERQEECALRVFRMAY